MSTETYSVSPNMFGERPWMSVLIPLAVVIGVGALLVGFTVMRRRNKKSHRVYLDQQGRQALERDLEARITRGYRVPGVGDAWGAGGTGGRRVRTANRWAWANNLALGRREEGLNELGEAPPPYEGRSGSAQKDETAVELGSVPPPPPPGNGNGREDAPQTGASGSVPVGMTGSVPPAYSESTGTNSTGVTPMSQPALGGRTTVAQPSPARLREEQISHRYG